MKTPPGLPLSREESSSSPPDKGDTGGFLQVAIEAATAAGETLRQEYQKNHTGQRKADNTLMSEADFAAEKVIIETIQKNFPSHAIFSEEAGLARRSFSEGEPDSEYLWLIDPLDGSTNFLHHLGNFCTAIALVKNQQPQLAAVYLPLTDELFLAEQGKDATLNGQTIRVSETHDAARNALVAWGRSSINRERHARLYASLTNHVRSLRFMGSVVMSACYTACGRFDTFVNSDIKLYDAMAGAIIAQAAGGVITDFSGNPWQPNYADPGSPSDILISNPHIHADLIAALKNV